MVRNVVLPLLTALALAGCKSEAAIPREPLAPAYSGYWVGNGRNASCTNGALRFDRKEIVQNRGGTKIPVFSIDAADMRGAVAELTLSVALPAAAMAFARNKQHLEQAKSFRLHVTLVNHGERITLSNAHMDNPVTGRIPARGSDYRKLERMFNVRKCAG